jgi:hypothetical protein
MTKAYPLSNRSVPSTRSWKRSEGPACSSSTSNCPEWPKYALADTMTGTFAPAGRFSGSRTSACSSVLEPSEEGK